MKPRFDLFRLTATMHYTPRRELHGEKREPAATIALSLSLPALELMMFDHGLPSALYEINSDGGVGDPRFPEIEAPIKWKREITGGVLTIHNGIGGVSDIRLPVEKADAFTIAPGEGGAFQLCFRVACHPGENQHGALAMKQDSDVEMSFESPAADLVEQAEGDKPLNTVGNADAPAAEGKPKRGGKRAARAAAERAFS